MRDGHTSKLATEDRAGDRFGAWQRQWQASLVLVSGDAAGHEYPLEQPSVTLGRGATAHLRFDDSTMSSEHAAVEFDGEGFRIRDLASMNGTLVNGGDVKAGALKHGDEIRLGDHTFQFLLEQRAQRPRTYQIPTA